MSTDGDSIDEALDIRRRYTRRVQRNRSVAERLANFKALQLAALRVLRESPEGYRRFLKRNMRSRRVEVIDGEWKPVAPARRSQLP